MTASCDTIERIGCKSGLKDWKRLIYSNRAVKYSNITVIYFITAFLHFNIEVLG